MTSSMSNLAMQEIGALYDMANRTQDNDSQLVSIVYCILDKVAEHQMSYVVRVAPAHMGIHP